MADNLVRKSGKSTAGRKNGQSKGTDSSKSMVGSGSRSHQLWAQESIHESLLLLYHQFCPSPGSRDFLGANDKSQTYSQCLFLLPLVSLVIFY